MKKLFFLLLLLQCNAFFLNAQSTLQGKVTDSDSGEELIFATVMVEQKGDCITSVFTDFNGNFSVSLDPGTYDIKVKYAGYPDNVMTDVVLTPGNTTELNIKVAFGARLDEVIVKEYKVPLIEMDHTTSGSTISSAAIRSLPIRNISNLAVTTVGLSATDEGDAVTVKGSRHKATDYYIDGIRISNVTLIPSSEIGRLEVITGGLPAAYGDRSDYTVVEKETAIRRSKSRKDRKSKTKKEQKIHAGILTAGEWNGLRDWAYWKGLLNDQDKHHRQTWKLFSSQRFAVEVVNKKGAVIPDCKVFLLDEQNNIIWQSRTDNQGRAELFANLFGTSDKGFKIMAEHHGQASTIRKAIDFDKKINRIELPLACKTLRNLDIAFVVDATGSMGDEINYLKAELRDVIQMVQEDNQALNIRTASVFYRDKGDEYLTRTTPFSKQINTTTAFIAEQQARGGGDFPEAVDAAMEEALNMDWQEKAIARILFLVLDAPPHTQAAGRIQQQIRKAAELGIRIIPITASGINKSTEFLMKTMAIATNGTYVFITDHSGVGNRHLEATVSAYNVEMLNDLMARLISEFSMQESCRVKKQDQEETVPDPVEFVKQELKHLDQIVHFYPNPAEDLVNIELKEAISEIKLINIMGKTVWAIPSPEAGTSRFFVKDLPAGAYLLQFKKGAEVTSKRLIVAKP